MAAFQVGDLVWAHVLGYPKWPGQVMDPSRAPAKALKKRLPGRQLVSFFGDNSFGWFTRDTLEPFAAGYEACRRQDTPKKFFRQAVEEAKELLDRREDREPATQHDPLDFLRMSEADEEQEDSSEDEGNVRAKPLVAVAGPLGPGAGQEASPGTGLHLLLGLARSAPAAEALRSQLTASLGRRGLQERQQLLTPCLQARISIAPRPGRPKRTAGVEAAEHKAPGRKRGRKAKVLGRGAGEEAAEEAAPTPKKLCKASSLVAHGAGAAPGAAPSSPGLEDISDAEDDTREASMRPESEGGMDWAELTGYLRALSRCPRDQLLQYDTIRDALGRWRDEVFASASEQPHKAMKRRGSLLEAEPDDDNFQASEDSQDEPEAKFGRQKQAGRKSGNRGSGGGGGFDRRRKGIKADTTLIRGEAMRVAYLDKVPPTQEEFMAALEAFYTAHGAPFEAQVEFNRAMGDKQLDLFAIFRAVAAEGGYDCVCLRHSWRKVCQAWDEELAKLGGPVVPTTLRKRYAAYLLAYERHISAGCPETLAELKSKGPRQIKLAGQEKGKVQKGLKEAGSADPEPAPSGAGASRHYATEENPEDTEDSGDSSSSEFEEQLDQQGKQGGSRPAELREYREKQHLKGLEEERAHKRRKPSISEASSMKPEGDVPSKAARQQEQANAAFVASSLQPTVSDRARQLANPGEDTVFLEFPKGIILPSKQQVQARFRRYHIADGDDSVRVSKKSSKVLTRFSSDLWAAEAMLAARANAHIWFGTEKGQTQAYLAPFQPLPPPKSTTASHLASRGTSSNPQVPQGPRPPSFNPMAPPGSLGGTPRSRAPVPAPRPVGQVMRPSGSFQNSAGHWRGQLHQGPSQPQRGSSGSSTGPLPGPARPGEAAKAAGDPSGDGPAPQDPRKRRALQSRQEARASAQGLGQDARAAAATASKPAAEQPAAPVPLAHPSPGPHPPQNPPAAPPGAQEPPGLDLLSILQNAGVDVGSQPSAAALQQPQPAQHPAPFQQGGTAQPQGDQATSQPLLQPMQSSSQQAVGQQPEGLQTRPPPSADISNQLLSLLGQLGK